MRFPSSGSWTELNKQHRGLEQKALVKAVNCNRKNTCCTPRYTFSVRYQARTAPTHRILIKQHLHVHNQAISSSRITCIFSFRKLQRWIKAAARWRACVGVLPTSPGDGAEAKEKRGAHGDKKQKCSCALPCPPTAGQVI